MQQNGRWTFCLKQRAFEYILVKPESQIKQNWQPGNITGNELGDVAKSILFVSYPKIKTY